MLYVRKDDKRLVKKYLFTFGIADVMTHPILADVAAIPIKTLPIKGNRRICHGWSILCMYTPIKGLFAEAQRIELTGVTRRVTSGSMRERVRNHPEMMKKRRCIV